MALNLVEAANIAMGRDETLKAVIYEIYARSSNILMALPFESIPGNALKYLREKTLPNAGFRGLNEGYTEGTGEFDRLIESLAITGGDLDVDKFIIDTMGMNQRSIQEAAKVKAISLAWTKAFVKGDTDDTPKGFDGLQARITESNQLITNSTTANGGSLSLIKLDEAIDAVEDPSHLVMNKTMARRISAAARDTDITGYIIWERDAFGRRILKYNDLPILTVDKDESNDDIMAFDEAAASGTDTATSIYVLSMQEDGVVGLQNGEMNVRDLGELEAKPVFRTRIEWYTTFAILRPKAAARLRYISNAAVMA